MSENNTCPECLATIPKNFKLCPKCQAIILQGIDIYKELVEIIGITVLDDVHFIEHNIQAAISTYTGDPNNLMPEAPTSEGKTYGTVQTTGLFPETDVFSSTARTTAYFPLPVNILWLE